MLPRAKIAGLNQPEPASDIIKLFGSFDTGDVLSGDFYTDGAGGKYSTDPRIRRVGFGAAQVGRSISGAFSVLGFLCGSFAGKQTVPRAELFAIYNIILIASGNVNIYTDHKNHVDRYRKGIAACLVSAQGDIWALIFEAIARRGSTVNIYKVKAHADVYDVVSGLITPIQLYGNYAADAAAESGAEFCQVPDAFAEQVKHYDMLVWRICRRIAAIHMYISTKSSHRARKIVVKKATPLSAILFSSEHVFIKISNNTVKCTACGISASRSTLAAVARLGCRALHTPATLRPRGVGLPVPSDLVGLALSQTAGQRFHPSHKLGYYRGVTFCWRCGMFTAVRVQGLGKPCTIKPTTAGMFHLNCFRLGQAPPSLKGWPLDANCSEVRLVHDPALDGAQCDVAVPFVRPSF